MEHSDTESITSEVSNITYHDDNIVSVSSVNTENIYSPEVCKLANYIRKHLETSNTYIFRCTKIDGIYCCCVIYKYIKFVNVESVRVLVKNSDDRLENYSLHFEYYNTIEDAIEIVKRITSSYKLYNGDLYSPEDYKCIIAEEFVLPFGHEQTCLSCNKSTNDIISCYHYICFHCRELLLSSGEKDCPVCNEPDVLHIYHNDVNIINNFHYNDLIHAAIKDSEYTDDDDSDENYNDEDEDEDEDCEAKTLWHYLFSKIRIFLGNE